MKLSVHLIEEAISASPYRKGKFNTYFHLDPYAEKIVNAAVKRGYITRRSVTQAEWTEEGLELARKELANFNPKEFSLDGLHIPIGDKIIGFAVSDHTTHGYMGEYDEVLIVFEKAGRLTVTRYGWGWETSTSLMVQHCFGCPYTIKTYTNKCLVLQFMNIRITMGALKNSVEDMNRGWEFNRYSSKFPKIDYSPQYIENKETYILRYWEKKLRKKHNDPSIKLDVVYDGNSLTDMYVRGYIGGEMKKTYVSHGNNKELIINRVYDRIKRELEELEKLKAL